MLLGVFPRMCSRCGTRQFEHEGLREAVCGWGMQLFIAVVGGAGGGGVGPAWASLWGLRARLGFPIGVRIGFLHFHFFPECLVLLFFALVISFCVLSCA